MKKYIIDKIKINADIIRAFDKEGYVIGKLDITMETISGIFLNYKKGWKIK